MLSVVPDDKRHDLDIPSSILSPSRQLKEKKNRSLKLGDKIMWGTETYHPKSRTNAMS
jgi:hypothetical protein